MNNDEQGLNASTNFEYATDAGGTKLPYPYGGYQHWQYGTFPYTGSLVPREVLNGYVPKAVGAGDATCATLRASGDSAAFAHSTGTVIGATSARKEWTFRADVSGPGQVLMLTMATVEPAPGRAVRDSLKFSVNQPIDPA
ncbi:MAG: hypothetical protein EXQ52_11705 [Bryobacterales bacterium]|nr:hypothetical protein [Bryobacterales bacterium]